MAVLEQSAPVSARLARTVNASEIGRLAAGRPDHLLRRLLALGDVVAILAALTCALALSDDANAWRGLLWGALVLPVAVLLFKLYGLYDRDVKRISHSTVDELPWLLHAVMTGTLLLWFYSKVSPLHKLDLLQATVFAGLLLLFASSLRAAVRFWLPRLYGPETALLVGDGEMAEILVHKLDAHPEHGVKVVGQLVSGGAGERRAAHVDVLGTTVDLAPVASAAGVRRVIVSASALGEAELAQLLRRCRALSLKVTLIPELSDLLGPAVEVDDVEGVTLLGVNPPWLPRSSRFIKRAMDIVVAAALLILFVPVLLLVALAIKLDSRGPVFFSQPRVGKGGERFRVWKFRTMVKDAEARREQLLRQSTDPHWLKLDHDPRITRVGGLIRRLSLDEIPQLWNVLHGQMSMVGPRPLVESEDERVEGWGRSRLDLTPGITGYWQVLGRTRIPFDEMVKLDYLYVTSWSLWADLRLMLRTLPTVLSGRGAN
jgi:exopolysaccharide biosynthesis polyprenyl glycosylphosphotransferase